MIIIIFFIYWPDSKCVSENLREKEAILNQWFSYIGIWASHNWTIVAKCMENVLLFPEIQAKHLVAAKIPLSRVNPRRICSYPKLPKEDFLFSSYFPDLKFK